MSPDRPAPEPDAVSAPFFEALSEGRFCLQHCEACGTWQLGTRACVQCGAREPAWRPVGGTGRVVEATRIHLAYHRGFKDTLPYGAARIELDEGPRLYGNVVDAAGQPLAPAIGTRVVARPDRLSTGVTVPVFTPSD